MNKKVAFEKDAWEEYIYWQKNDLNILRRVNLLIKYIERNGVLKGIGNPERLKGKLKGMHLRKINLEHRLVYYIEDNIVFILVCKTHYNDL